MSDTQCAPRMIDLRLAPAAAATWAVTWWATGHPAQWAWIGACALAALGCAAIHPDDTGLTAEEVARMRDAGFEVNVWTVNDLDRARELASWGVAGIFTDRPQDFPAEALAR